MIERPGRLESILEATASQQHTATLSEIVKQQENRIEHLKAAAFHEAGHALLYTVFGEHIDGITINPDGTGMVHQFGIQPMWARMLMPEPMSVPGRCQDAMISLAGAITEDIFTDELYNPMAILQYGGGLHDWSHIQSLLLPDALVDDLIGLTTQAVLKHRAKVQSLAERLLVQKSMTPAEVDQLLVGVYDFSCYSKEIKRLIRAYSNTYQL